MHDFATDISRGRTFAAVLLSAVVHVDLWARGNRDIQTNGPLFLFNVLAGLGIGVMILVRRRWQPLIASDGFATAPVIAFWISVVCGLVGVNEVATATSEVLAEFTAVVFGVTVAALLWQAMRERAA